MVLSAYNCAYSKVRSMHVLITANPCRARQPYLHYDKIINNYIIIMVHNTIKKINIPVIALL